MARSFSGQRLHQLRLDRGVKPEYLAVQIGRSVSSIFKYEADLARPSAEVLAALADSLNCQLDDLFAAMPSVAA